MPDLPLWRDVAIVLLALEVMVGLAPLLVVCYFGVRYVPRGLRWLQNTLRQMRRGAERFQCSTLGLARTVISPLIAIGQAVAFGRGLLRGAITGLRGNSQKAWKAKEANGSPRSS